MKKKFTKALVTGGSSGIGYAIAAQLVGAGASVLLVARSEEKLDAAAGKLRPLAGPSQIVATCPADVSDRGQVEGPLSAALDSFGAIDLLVNCAGIAVCNYFDAIDTDAFDRAIAIDARGPWLVTKLALPRLKTPGGTVLNVSSMAGLIGVFGYTAYSAAKFAVMGFSEALRAELALKGISVTVLCPPDTDTPQLEEENRTKPPETRAVSGNAPLMQPGAVASAALRGAAAGRFLVVPSFANRLIVLAAKLVPGVVRRITDSDARKARKPEI